MRYGCLKARCAGVFVVCGRFVVALEPLGAVELRSRNKRRLGQSPLHLMLLLRIGETRKFEALSGLARCLVRAKLFA